MIRAFIFVGVTVALITAAGCGGGGGGGGGSGSGGSPAPSILGGSSTGGERNPVCSAGQSSGEVRQPEFVRNLNGQTSWFASPIVADLDDDGEKELIAAYYSLYAFSPDGVQIDRVDGNSSRIYAPHVVVDLDGDGTVEIVCGQGKNVYVYEWKERQFSIKQGWPKDTTCAGSSPEVRGLAAADLDGNGSIEIIATTTQTLSTASGGAQVYVWSYDGTLYQPAGLAYAAWPRYNNRSGAGGDADRNEMGHSGFGCYGLNVAVGNIDDDAEREIIVTYDNHHIQVFDPNGEAIDAAGWFTNRSTDYLGNRMTWGQFIRWCDPDVEEDHYHLHTGTWPNPSWTEWLQWTASPPQVADLDLDGQNEVIGIPNVELNIPYETQAYAVMVLEGAYGDGSRSAMRKAGWEVLPRGDFPVEVDGYYPPGGVPAAAIVDLQGDTDKEIIVSLNDGFMYCFSAHAEMIWRFNYTNGKAIMYASEPMVADLNRDGSPEVIFSTYGDPDVDDSGHLILLGADGSLLHDIALPDPGYNGNGNGAPAAPTIADLDSDGQLEILVQTFDHGMDIFTVPDSGEDCLLWATARGGPLRMGQPSGME
jgi:hypothetical protein